MLFRSTKKQAHIHVVLNQLSNLNVSNFNLQDAKQAYNTLRSIKKNCYKTSVLSTSIAIFLEFKNNSYTIVNHTCKSFIKLTPGLMRFLMKSNTKGLSILLFCIQAAVTTVKED